MCGIGGVWDGRDGEQAVAAMLQLMHHRGPDGSGIHTFPGGAVGMVRLALVDLSPKGQQPMFSPDGRGIIDFIG